MSIMMGIRSCRKNFVPRIFSSCVSALHRGLSGASAGGSVKHYSSVPIAYDKLLEGQVAIITGGASGIGARTARLFTSHGARVVIADIQTSLGEKLLKELGPQAAFVQCDVRKEEDIINAWDTAYALENKLDIVFNNAGIAGAMGPIDLLHTEEYDMTVAVNLRGVVLGIKHAARLMKPAMKGSILVTSSVAGVVGGVGPTAYTVTKGAVVSLVRAAAVELGNYGIRVNAISPDLVPTRLASTVLAAVYEGTELSADYGEEMVAQVAMEASLIKGRALSDVDVANAALYLASEIGGYVSGHNLVVDGGSTTTQVKTQGGNQWVTKYRPMLSENGRRGL